MELIRNLSAYQLINLSAFEQNHIIEWIYGVKFWSAINEY